MTDYTLATVHSWNIERFTERRSVLPGRWHLFVAPVDLTAERLKSIRPRYLFFPHWSWKVPREIFIQSETILFHMTDLPYGRGGSPLQNLIMRGHDTTMISAVRMTEELDAGPIYMKRPLDLRGSAREIFQRASHIVFDMIEEIVRTEPQPQPQEGKATLFKRRTPQMSEFPQKIDTLENIYDHIRMLDAPGYPRAYIQHRNYRIEFSDTSFNGEVVEAKASFFLGKGLEDEK